MLSVSLSNMEGEFGTTEAIKQTPTSILGNKVYQSLLARLPQVCSQDELNSSSFYKTPQQGVVIDFYYLNGAGLSDADWEIAKETARSVFSDLKDTDSDNAVTDEQIILSFIESPEPGERKIVIKTA